MYRKPSGLGGLRGPLTAPVRMLLALMKLAQAVSSILYVEKKIGYMILNYLI